MKIIITAVLCLCLFLQGSTRGILDQNTPSDSPSACTESCTVLEDQLISSEVNDQGNQVLRYESGVEVEYISETEWIIRDYSNVFEAEIPENQARVNWLEIGKVILKYVGKVLEFCQAIQYISGHDLCRIVLSYLTNPPVNGTVTYLVTGNYIPGYIPGCEPRNSLPCNSGYWEYRIIYQ